MFMAIISRKRVFQEMEEDEQAMAEVLGLCANGEQETKEGANCR